MTSTAGPMIGPRIVCGINDAFVDDIGLGLPRIELALFRSLVEAREQICTFRELARAGWNSDDQVVHAALKTAISRLRDLLSGTRLTIRCHRDLGYRLVANREAIGEPSPRQYRADGIYELERRRAAALRVRAPINTQAFPCLTLPYCCRP